MAQHAATTTLTGRAYDRVRGDILGGRLEPGAPLRLAALARELDVSMSVVREALSRLSAEGLVTASPNQGFRVVPLSTDDLVDLTELRIDLESLALRRSIERGDVQWEAGVLSAHHVLERTPLVNEDGSGASVDWIAAHAAFHDALGAGCGSPRLIKLVHAMRDGAEVYRQWAGPLGAEGGRDIAAEHRNLMELATARRAEEATAALGAHLQRTTDLLIGNRAAAGSTGTG